MYACRIIWYNVDMLFSVINKIFKSIIKLLASIVGFLMFRLYLWVPVVIAIGFLIASAAIPFVFDDYTAYFVILIIAGTALSAVLCANKYFISPVRRIVRKPKPLVLPNPDRAARVRDDYPDGVRGALRDEPRAPASNPSRGFGSGGLRYYEDDDRGGPLPSRDSAKTDYCEPYRAKTDYTGRTDYPPDGAEGYHSYGDNYKARHTAPVERADKPAPSLFRTRKDPTLFIAQYEDRVEYYRKTASGDYLLVSVEDPA